MPTKQQLARLGAEARKAFDSVPAEDLEALRVFLWDQTPHDGDDPFAGPHMVTRTRLFDAWRRKETANALRGLRGRGSNVPNSFKKLTNRDVDFVVAHFVSFYNPSEAADLFSIAQQRDYATAMAILDQSCRSRKLEFPAYPEKICRDQFGCGLDSASAKQIWRLVYTCRNRRSCKSEDEKDFDRTKRWKSSFARKNN